ncbi:MAG: tRNA-binding protein [Gemmatimonadota bacterium]
MERKKEAEFERFAALDIRLGKVISAEHFPEARRPSIKLRVDCGPEVGILQSSARLTHHYTPEELVGSPVLAVVNLPPLRVAGFRSECLVLGLLNPDDPGEVVLIRPDAGKGEVDEWVGWPLG